MPALPRLLWPVKEAAQVLGVSPWIIYKMAERGEIRSVHIGRRVMIPNDAIEEIVGRPVDGLLAAAGR